MPIYPFPKKPSIQTYSKTKIFKNKIELVTIPLCAKLNS